MARLLPPIITLSVLLLAAWAGCLDQSAKPSPSPSPSVDVQSDAIPPGFVDPFISGHDHSDAKLHDLKFNMVETFHHPLGGNMLKSSGAHAVEIQNGYLFVAAYGASADVSGGLYIFDLHQDPEKPKLVGQLNLAGSLGGDRSMEATDDANYVVLGMEAQDCAGHTNPFAPGMYLIDTRDKTRPLISDYLPATGVHSVVIHRIKGEDYAFALMSGKNVVHIDRSGPRATLVAVGSLNMGHDGAAYDDPVLGKPIFYAANGNDILYIYDISNPGTPVLLGKWKPEPGHYVHAVAVQFVEGRRLIVVESEDWKGTPSPMWTIDGTDLSNPELIGTWTNPGNHSANDGKASTPPGTFGGQLTFSTHNPRLENGIVYMAHYHAGVWVLNVSTIARAEHPQILGYYLPHNDNGGFKAKSAEGAYPKPNSCGFDLTEIPNTFDVEVQNGIAYAADLHTGLYVMKLATPPILPK